MFADQKAKITITPTYSGCPAMSHIEKDISHVLNTKRYKVCRSRNRVVTGMDYDWIDENGKKKLFEYGIAPPVDEPDKAFFLKPQKNTMSAMWFYGYLYG